MSNTSSTTRKRAATKPAPAAAEEKPAPVAGSKKTEARKPGQVFVSTNGQILRQSDNGLQLLYSPQPVTNIHPNLYDDAEYERLVAERFGDLKLIHES